jgi:hypothetical protein
MKTVRNKDDNLDSAVVLLVTFATLVLAYGLIIIMIISICEVSNLYLPYNMIKISGLLWTLITAHVLLVNRQGGKRFYQYYNSLDILFLIIVNLNGGQEISWTTSEDEYRNFIKWYNAEDYGVGEKIYKVEKENGFVQINKNNIVEISFFNIGKVERIFAPLIQLMKIEIPKILNLTSCFKMIALLVFLIMGYGVYKDGNFANYFKASHLKSIENLILAYVMIFITGQLLYTFKEFIKTEKDRKMKNIYYYNRKTPMLSVNFSVVNIILTFVLYVNLRAILGIISVVLVKIV